MTPYVRLYSIKSLDSPRPSPGRFSTDNRERTDTWSCSVQHRPATGSWKKKGFHRSGDSCRPGFVWLQRQKHGQWKPFMCVSLVPSHKCDSAPECHIVHRYRTACPPRRCPSITCCRVLDYLYFDERTVRVLSFRKRNIATYTKAWKRVHACGKELITAVVGSHAWFLQKWILLCYPSRS